MVPLTRRQMEVLRLIETFVDRNGYAPTYRELAGLMGARSTHAATTMLTALRVKGYVAWPDPGARRARTIGVLKSVERW